jgi:transcriptional regulator with XRE-family HTH domain
MSAQYTTPIAKNRFSQERFPEALKGLMDERRLSYRQLAYKTKLSAGYLNHLTKATRPVPADLVVAVIAGALCVEPDFFIEYRLRQIVGVLDEAPGLTDQLYAILLRNQLATDDIIQALAGLGAGNGNGGNGGNGRTQGAVVGF